MSMASCDVMICVLYCLYRFRTSKRPTEDAVCLPRALDFVRMHGAMFYFCLGNFPCLFYSYMLRVIVSLVYAFERFSSVFVSCWVWFLSALRFSVRLTFVIVQLSPLLLQYCTVSRLGCDLPSFAFIVTTGVRNRGNVRKSCYYFLLCIYYCCSRFRVCVCIFHVLVFVVCFVSGCWGVYVGSPGGLF